MRRLWPPPPLSLLLALLSAAALCGGGGAAPASHLTEKLPSTSAPPQSVVRAGPDDAPSGTPGGSGPSVGEGARGSGVNGSSSMAVAPPVSEVNKLMTQRALSVLVLASAALIVYFVIRTVRLRRRNRKTRKYGVLDTNIENTELTPLEQDDDDDDNTLFDANHPRR
ncbi:membrane protein FAM174A [Candoia aspera]|uniref:membrane protein FAM174A n=1 Tax=Candoia aspera TaxID=51853 RepID=UPI002FD7C253